jgi:fumarylpyruvate hydrolase
MTFLFPAPTQPSLAVVGTEARFPVRRIYCVGQNYATHAREMGGDPDRDPPFFFSKPTDALVPGGGEVAYPPATANLHHEVELVVALDRGGRNLSVEESLSCVLGYAVGLDLTRRDLQARAKEQGRPWDLAKGFDQSAPVSAVLPVAGQGHPTQGAIWLQVNGVERQRGDLAQLTWGVAEVISHLSAYVALAPGDLIFTGTPAGVGILLPGDQVRCGIDGVGQLAITLV